MLQESEQNKEREPEMIMTDAETVKELVEMKYWTKKRRIRYGTPQQRIVSKKCEVVVDNDTTYHARQKF